MNMANAQDGKAGTFAMFFSGWKVVASHSFVRKSRSDPA